MKNNTPPLYALTPITETEGLEDNKPVYGLYEFANIQRLRDSKATNYLRPLPEGTVAVTNAQLEKLILETWEQADRTADEYAQYPYGRFNGYQQPDKEAFIQTKLAQMGE